MTPIADSGPAVAPQVIAGLLLAARDHQLRLGLPSATVDQIVEKTSAARSSAYETKEKIIGTLPALVRPVGRPASGPKPPPESAQAISRDVLRFVMDHPGCVHGGLQHRQYDDSFRRHVLSLHAKHPELSVELLSREIEVPLDTIRDWLRPVAPPDAAAPVAPADAVAACAEPTAPSSRNLHIQTVLTEWQNWSGRFIDFCVHVREHLRVPFGRSAIADILAAHGFRHSKRRKGRSSDEIALREAFETFFPGAQWVADGTKVCVDFCGKRYAFNLELTVDAHSGALTGASIRDEEDSAALIQAIDDGKTTTGAAPLAVLVDNRPSNLTPEVCDALAEETLLIAATPGRPQNKAHVEGAFGLFFQMRPPLAVMAATDREVARQIVRLVVTTWARTLNHRPRKDRGGRSRVEIYAHDKPTPEQIAEARAALENRIRRQEAARRTLQARQDPIVRQTIAAAFQRLGFEDPKGHLLDAIARYPLDPVIDGIALFEGKQAAGSLPRDLELPGRYLLGIVRNIAHQREGELISEAMLRARLEAQDAQLAGLDHSRRLIREQTLGAPQSINCFIDNALNTVRSIDRIFWLSAASDVMRDRPKPDRPALFRLAARRITAWSRVPYGERLKAVRWLAHKAFPVD